MDLSKTQKKWRLGIIGCSRIAEHAVINPCRCQGYIEPVGVAGSDKIRAEQYASRFGIDTVYSTPEDLLDSSDIDCVYISSTNDLHGTLGWQAAEAGKHVLIEKPASLQPEFLERTIDFVKAGKLVYLEGIMTRHHSWQKKVLNLMEQYDLGPVVRIESFLSTVLDPGNSALWRSNKEKGGGAFWDQGSYWIQFLQLLMGDLSDISFRGEAVLTGSGGIDTSFNATITWPGTINAVLNASFGESLQASHCIHFEKGSILIPNFMRPYFGKYKMVMFLTIMGNPKTERIEMEPEFYFSNQLDRFVSMMDGDWPEQTSDLNEMLERTVLMAGIMDSSRQETPVG